MRLMSAAVAALVVVATLEVSAASAQECGTLWVERNTTYYRQAGYCFRTGRRSTISETPAVISTTRRGSGLRLTSAAASTNCSGWSGCWAARAEQLG
jgi:hypothetical protein